MEGYSAQETNRSAVGAASEVSLSSFLSYGIHFENAMIQLPSSPTPSFISNVALGGSQCLSLPYQILFGTDSIVHDTLGTLYGVTDAAAEESLTL